MSLNLLAFLGALAIATAASWWHAEPSQPHVPPIATAKLHPP